MYLCLRESKFVLMSERNWRKKLSSNVSKYINEHTRKPLSFVCVYVFLCIFFLPSFFGSIFTCKHSIYLIQHKMNALITYQEWMRIKDGERILCMYILDSNIISCCRIYFIYVYKVNI